MNTFIVELCNTSRRGLPLATILFFNIYIRTTAPNAMAPSCIIWRIFVHLVLTVVLTPWPVVVHSGAASVNNILVHEP
jgi:hypothetical protein